MKRLITVLAATTLLTACQQAEQSYDNNQNTYQGAAIGAILGGVAGALADDDNRGDHAAIGAAIGAIAGGGYGQYVDQQEAALRQATEGTGIDVKRHGNDLLLNVPSSITFAVDSSAIQPGFRLTLSDVASVLKEYPSTIVEILGHTDDTGADSYNLALSDRRAKSVADYLVYSGVGQRMIATGLGESQPIASNATEDGRAQNRRVEIKITPISRPVAR